MFSIASRIGARETELASQRLLGRAGAAGCSHSEWSSMRGGRVRTILRDAIRG